jgi:hypothetical protein
MDDSTKSGMNTSDLECGPLNFETSKVAIHMKAYDPFHSQRGPTSSDTK